MTDAYDSILVVSFGGPEGMAEVMPFLENVTRGRGIPRERLLEVAHHYETFGGVSPINQQNRELIKLLKRELAAHGPHLPVYWGNRNWHPYLADTMKLMAKRGHRRTLAFVTSAFSSYSGCRQYRENIAAAQAACATEMGVDTESDAIPRVDKLRVFYNHPGFIEPQADRVREAIATLPSDVRDKARLIFTAHSIPVSMATTSKYEDQLREACRLVAEAVGRDDWALVYQSRSGPPSQPWLEPDVCDYLKEQKASGAIEAAVVTPIGFISDHLEVLFDLDEEARETCAKIGLPMARAGTVGVDPRFITMIRQLIDERLSGAPKLALGTHGPSHDVCPSDCCPRPVRPGRPGATTETKQAVG